MIVDLRHAAGVSPHMAVANQPESIKEIVETIREYLQEDKVTAAEAAELRGRLVFFNSQTQTLGRMCALVYHHFGKQAICAGGSSSISQEWKWDWSGGAGRCRRFGAAMFLLVPNGGRYMCSQTGFGTRTL